ncbi:MAG TPA: flagellar hook protein FlgE [Burkholderiaceae bacterium]|nr:flagellar hook protein FlgE [Burkholderiaceae bacterium]
MGFGQGLSGLNAASQSLDVIGNNIANSGTVGFKSGTATFADVYANSRVGLGTSVASINQRFTIGTISGTGNQFDMAIDGARGMFRVVEPSGAVLYSRNGQFAADKDNYIINAQGQRLTGYINGSTTPSPIMVPVGNIEPSPTELLTFKSNFDGNEPAIDNTTTPFSPTNSDSYTHYYPVTVYDSLGNKHQLDQYFVKRQSATAGQSEWNVYYRSAGLTVTPADADLTTLTFDDAGRLLTTPATVDVNIDVTGGASPAAAIAMKVNYADSTQFAGPFSPNFTQDGYPTGEYASMSVAADGSIVASYTNGETKSVGTLVLAHFNNLQGLQPVGGNAWAETGSSGQPILGVPGQNGMAQIKGQAVEESNVDMSQELVNMIIAQRTYQANAQTIKTQDQVLQTLINLR